MKRLEVVTNIAVLLAVVVFIAFVGRQEFERRNAPHPRSAQEMVGRTVQLPGVQFSSANKTLLLAISTTCHFCKDSEPFYKDLLAKNHSGINIIAVLPQPLAEAQSYVRQSIAPSVQVVSAQLDSIGVGGTPTLLLIDGGGKVQQAWVGKLDDKGQQQVESMLM
jgi:hypothetical protein